MILYSGRINTKTFCKVLKEQYIPEMRARGIKRILGDHDATHASAGAKEIYTDEKLEYSKKPPPPCHSLRCRCVPPDGLWFPVKCPECQPAERVNNWLQQDVQRMAYEHGPPKDLAHLRRRYHQARRNLPPGYTKKLMAGQQRRVEALLKAKGGYFKI